jgi:iron complex outermembrane receptor protein
LNHDQTDGHRDSSDFKITNGYAKIGYNFSEHFYASTDFSLAAYKASDPGPDTLNAKAGESIDITRGYWAFTLQNEFEKASGTLKLFYNFGEHNITDGFHSKDNNFGLNFYESIHPIKGNTITLGFDYNQYGGLAENLLAMRGAGIVFADTTITETGTYAFIQQVIASKLTINGGIRYSHHSVYGGEWIPSAGFAFQIDKNTTWKGNVAKGFRSPTMRELFLWGPNPKLDPESILSYETGISRSFFGNKAQTELTIYALNGDNLIVNVPMQGLQNSGEVSNKGIELAIKANPVKKLFINSTYSFIDMKSPVYATPKHHFFLSTQYNIGDWQLLASVQQISDLDNDPTQKVNLESYTLLNAKTTYQLNQNIKLYISGENLLGTNYQSNRYYTMPGTTVFGGVSFMF